MQGMFTSSSKKLFLLISAVLILIATGIVMNKNTTPPNAMNSIRIGEDAQFQKEAAKLPQMEAAIALSRTVAEKENMSRAGDQQYVYSGITEMSDAVWLVTWSIPRTEPILGGDLYITIDMNQKAVIDVKKGQ